LGHRSKIKYEYDFLNIENQTVLVKILKNRFNYAHYHEIIQLSPAETNAENTAKMLSAHCAILLKGGHHPEKLVSILYIQKRDHPFLPKNHRSQKNMVQVVFYRLLLFLTLL
jgi:hydroxymethylpyrimidine/phosphomethylpyrimidine kinase